MHVKGFSFSSYLKLLTIISLSSGLFFGIILFIISIFGGNVYANLGTIQLHGVIAGIVNIILSPLVFVFFGFIFSLLSFLPFKYALKYMNGIKITLNYEQNDS